MTTCNVLSIDFDYFQNIPDEKLLRLYPDGVDLPSVITCITWAGVYVYPEENNPIYNVTLRQPELNFVKSIIKTMPKYATNYIVNSHVHIYDMLKSMHEQMPDTKLHVYNLDLHHDAFIHGGALTCGNWVRHIKHDFDADTTWIANPLSQSILKPVKDPSPIDVVTTDIHVLNGISFNAAFLCRSDTWLPPHLDTAFEDLRQCFADQFLSSLTDKQVSTPRDLSNLIRQYQAIIKGESTCQH